ncbi:MAG: hypothetical protein KKG78_02395 [Alphaproteobacteria bacterium]|nr:hypothetical protein [Alphaproteobacteria bacterium]
MANAENKRLAVDVIARIDKLEKGMAKAASTVDKRTGDMERRTKRFAGNFEKNMVGAVSRVNSVLGKIGLAGAIAGVLAPVVSLGAALAGAKNALADFDKIAKAAKASGLDGEFFQELAYQADLGGVNINELSSALQTFTKNAGLAAEGKGRMVSQLKALNPELLDSIKNARSQEERVKLAADALDKEADASKRAAIATVLFGDAGTRMVEVFKGGSAAIDQAADAARNMGLVIDREVLANAEAMNDQLSIATKVIDAEFSKALVDIAPLLVSAAQLAGNVAAAIGGIVDAMREVENQSTRGLNGSLASLGQERLDIENRILELQDRQRNNTSVIAGAEGKLDTAIPALKERLAAISAEEARALAVLSSRRQSAAAAGAARTTGAAAGPVTGSSDTVTKSRSSSASAAVREAEAVAKLVDQLRTERAEIGASDVARAQSAALRQAGKAATAEQRDEIVRLIAAIYEENAAMDEASAAMDDFKSTSKDVASGFISDLRQGKTAAEALAGALNKVADKLIDVALNSAFGIGGKSGGGFLSFLPKLFGFADGGYTGPGGKYAPAGIVHKGEYVMDADSTKRIGVNNLRKLQGYAAGGMVGAAPSMPSMAPMRQAPSGGQITVTTISEVQNGNLVPTMTLVAGQVAGKQVRQANRNLQGRLATVKTRGV